MCGGCIDWYRCYRLNGLWWYQFFGQWCWFVIIVDGLIALVTDFIVDDVEMDLGEIYVLPLECFQLKY